MRCWDARLAVCDYIDDALAGTARERLERHLHECPTCPALYAALAGVQDRMGTMRDPDTVIPPDTAARVVAALGREAAPGREADD